MKIKRSVVSTKEHLNPGWEKSWAVGGSRILSLDCGHTKRQKISERKPDKTFCHDCDTLSNGAVRTAFNVKARTAEVEVWDPTKQMPTKSTRPMTDAEIEYWTR